MFDAIVSPPRPINEPVLSYAPGSPERAPSRPSSPACRPRPSRSRCSSTAEEVETGVLHEVRAPHRRDLLLGARATRARTSTWRGRSRRRGAPTRAGRACRGRRGPPSSSRRPSSLATRWRPVLNAATMLGQSKTAHQAEIDSACELIDFFRFNVHFAEPHRRRAAAELARACGTCSSPARSRASSSPARRSTSPPSPATCPPRPRIMGNTVVWKPARERAALGPLPS